MQFFTKYTIKYHQRAVVLQQEEAVGWRFSTSVPSISNTSDSYREFALQYKNQLDFVLIARVPVLQQTTASAQGY